MGYTVIRYSVKDASLEENRALIAKVFDELNQSTPPALQYLALELEDGEFIHVVGMPDGDSTSPLPRLAAFRAFTEGHAERRSAPVMRSPAKVVGNYRMLADVKTGT
jgi:ABC-type uncharacterized transport system ATPase component